MSGAFLIPLLAFVVGFAGPTYADEPNDPFGKNTIEVNEGSLETIWKSVRQQLLNERLQIAFCIECPEVAELRSIVKEARQNEGKALLGHLNRSINLMIKLKSGDWVGALEAMQSRSGDCKSYSIAKYVAALEAGIPSSRIRLVIVHNRRRHQDHMVAAIYDKEQWLILDNLTMLVLRDSEKTDYEPMFVLDDTGVRRYF